MCTCGSALVKNGSETRTVATIGDKVTYKRTRMQKLQRTLLFRRRPTTSGVKNKVV